MIYTQHIYSTRLYFRGKLLLPCPGLCPCPCSDMVCIGVLVVSHPKLLSVLVCVYLLSVLVTGLGPNPPGVAYLSLSVTRHRSEHSKIPPCPLLSCSPSVLSLSRLAFILGPRSQGLSFLRKTDHHSLKLTHSRQKHEERKKGEEGKEEVRKSDRVSDATRRRTPNQVRDRRHGGFGRE